MVAGHVATQVWNIEIICGMIKQNYGIQNVVKKFLELISNFVLHKINFQDQNRFILSNQNLVQL